MAQQKFKNQSFKINLVNGLGDFLGFFFKLCVLNVENNGKNKNQKHI